MSAPTARVVVVDDDEAIVDFVSAYLETRGHTVERFAAPLDALDRLVAPGRPVDLLITDYRMPDVLGDELVACARDAVPGLPIIVLTGAVAVADSVLGQLPKAWILGKPFTLDELQERLDAALA